MQCVERHIIKRNDLRFAPIDAAAFAAKNLYNAANYLMRQAYIFNNERILPYARLYHRAKPYLPIRTCRAKSLSTS